MNPEGHDKIRSYAAAGVSIDAAEEVVQRIQQCMQRTHDRRVISRPDGYAGLFRLATELRSYKDPVLVSCSDGVGSKILIACQMEHFDTIGIDLVAMSINDLVTSGATPLFFLDYIAVHKNEPQKIAAIVESIAVGCEQAGCALLGGETAEMSDVYQPNELDLAGFAVGAVEHEELITGQAVGGGDVIIGLASSGLHANGYTLVRKIFAGDERDALNKTVGQLKHPLWQELLIPTRIYARPILSLLVKRPTVIKGMAHITGGGLPGNVPRSLPEDCQAIINKGSWHVADIFSILQQQGIPEDEMFRVFNMGIGMVLFIRAEDEAAVIRHFSSHSIEAWKIGAIHKGPRTLQLE